MFSATSVCLSVNSERLDLESSLLYPAGISRYILWMFRKCPQYDGSELGLPPVPDFAGCPGFAPCCPRPGKTSPGTPNVPDFKMQPKPKITTTIIITITIIGVIVLI